MATLPVRVTAHDHRAIPQARVTADRDGVTVAEATTDDRGRAALEVEGDGELTLRVEADGLAPDERRVRIEDRPRPEDFVLGPAGLPFYYRGTVRVPFEPVDGAVGVLLNERPPAEDASVPDETATRAEDVAASVGGSLLHSEGNFAASNVAVLSVPQTDSTDQDPATTLETLNGNDEVAQAGALVQLLDGHASFLTDRVIARFADGVDDATVAEIAQRHGLVPDGAVGGLDSVQRLRFPGAPTYAVLDAGNALAEEPQVMWAEPDLVHTVEHDAVAPADYLFGEQWDHKIIGTPDAWQTLRAIDASHTYGDPEIVIAVIDQGVDLTHPEFGGTVSNGDSKVYEKFDFTDMVASMDKLGGTHGTGCASASTAQTDRKTDGTDVVEGIAGVAGNCRLIAVRYPSGSESRYAEMYLWAAGFPVTSATAGLPAQITPGADVITNSYGTSVGSPISGLMTATFDRLTDKGRDGKGVLLFFSAGNDNEDLDDTHLRPWSMYDRCFGVAASTLANDGTTEIKASYSNFGSTVDFCAPSSDNEGVHNPPKAYGAFCATVLATPDGTAVPGRADRRTTLAVTASAGSTTLTLASVDGLAAGQALLVGAAGAKGAESRLVTAVDTGWKTVTVTPALSATHTKDTSVAVGPYSHKSSFGGTSYATPVSAGVGALMLSANRSLRWDQVRDILRETGVKIDPNSTDPAGRWKDAKGRISTDTDYAGPVVSEFYGYGRIDAAAAVRRAGAAARASLVGFGENGTWVSLNDGKNGLGAAALVIDDFAYSAGGWRVENHLRFMADVTGDGRADIVGFGWGGVWVSLNKGDGTFGTAALAVPAFGYGPEAGGWSVANHLRLMGDLTGDGRADILGFGDYATYVGLNDGKGGFGAPVKVRDGGRLDGDWRVDRHPRFLADVTGDGRADVVGVGYAGVWVTPNKGDGSFGEGVLAVNDFGYNVGGWRVEKHPRFMADLTGDGRADIVGCGEDGTWVSVNDGTGGFAAPKKVLDDFCVTKGWRVERHPRFLVDLTGDGRADIVGFGEGGVWAALGDGTGGFGAPYTALAGFDATRGWLVERHPRFLVDLTGDGRADIVGCGDDGVWVALNNGDGTFGPAAVLVKDFGYTAGGWRTEKHPRLVVPGVNQPVVPRVPLT